MLLPFVVIFCLTTSAVLMSIFNLCRFKSDEKSLADTLDYEKVETQRLSYENLDLMKKLQEANSTALDL